MTDSKPEKWSGEKKALKKTQVHFTFKDKMNQLIRHKAVDQNINPSDIVRKVVGLSYRRIQRPRIGLSFNEEELSYLANRYALDMNDEKEIKRKVMEEVNIHFHEELIGE